MSNEKKMGHLETECLRIRQQQLEINDAILSGEIKLPVHLALGHESIAVALKNCMETSDKILLTHRNIHFHLALNTDFESIRDEYLLKNSGISGGKLGSMNMIDVEAGNIYTSNILGNNLPVATGVALGEKFKNSGTVTWVATGDGAIEEGAFYESILNAKSLALPIIFIVENNLWSLGSSISERRVDIKLNKLAQALDIGYQYLDSNDVNEYANKLRGIRLLAIGHMSPLIVEVMTTTLGGYEVTENNRKRFVNYHAGKIDQERVKILRSLGEA